MNKIYHHEWQPWKPEEQSMGFSEFLNLAFPWLLPAIPFLVSWVLYGKYK